MEDPMMQGGPPPTGAPPGGPPPDDMMMAESERGNAMKGAAQAPMPTKPYTVKTVQGLVDQFNETLDALGGQDLPDLPFAVPEGTTKIEGPIPQEVYAPLYALKLALQEVGGGEFAKKYKLDCESMTDDTQVRKITGELARMAKDKALAKAMQEPMAPPAAEPPRAPAPSEFTQDDTDLMNGM